VIPESSNFFATLETARSRCRIAELFGPPTWIVRKCSWTDYEVSSTIADLVIEAESPTSLHGPVAEVEVNADRILATLQAAGIGYTAECYNAGGELLHVWECAAT
jgi:hypothetical protein